MSLLILFTPSRNQRISDSVQILQIADDTPTLAKSAAAGVEIMLGEALGVLILGIDAQNVIILRSAADLLAINQADSASVDVTQTVNLSTLIQMDIADTTAANQTDTVPPGIDQSGADETAINTEDEKDVER